MEWGEIDNSIERPKQKRKSANEWGTGSMGGVERAWVELRERAEKIQ